MTVFRCSFLRSSGALFSPPSTRAARGGEGSGVGGGSACTHADVEYAEAPPTPDPSPPSAFAQGLRLTGGGEKSVLAAGANSFLPDMR